MRRKNQELRQSLLDCARRIECAEGADALSVRKLASEANIAVGTVYNYFESKQEVMLAMTEEYWNCALKEMQGCITAERFSEQAADGVDVVVLELDAEKVAHLVEVVE